MKNNLDPMMQARLDRWRSSPVPIKSLIDAKKSCIFLPRREDPNHIYTDEEIKRLKQLHNPTKGN